LSSNGQITEPNGWEIKRPVESKMTKTMQGDASESHRSGMSNEQVYHNPANVSCRIPLLLRAHGKSLDNTELLGLLNESPIICQPLTEAGDRKYPPGTIALRLAGFIGNSTRQRKERKCECSISNLSPIAPVADGREPF
jgi:hypothetical protein